ncbi:MAG: hypothetical protein Q7T61_08605 [Caulobacter sp.]|nr:hypothetical protein [Caulobacter sp.]
MDFPNSEDCRLKAEQSELLSRVLSLIADRENFAALGRSWRLREVAALAAEARSTALDPS